MSTHPALSAANETEPVLKAPLAALVSKRIPPERFEMWVYRESTIGFLARHAAGAERARARMRRRGFTPMGHKLWTAEEDEIFLACVPDYRLAMSRLPGRSYLACRDRARTLGVAKSQPHWTAAGISRLRKLYPKASRDELAAAFPEKTLNQILKMAQARHIPRDRPRPSPTRFPIIDQIKLRARHLNYTMKDLDELARSKRYFARSGWLTRDRMDYRAIARAAKAMGGRLVIKWDDD